MPRRSTCYQALADAYRCGLGVEDLFACSALRQGMRQWHEQYIRFDQAIHGIPAAPAAARRSERLLARFLLGRFAGYVGPG